MNFFIPSYVTFQILFVFIFQNAVHQWFLMPSISRFVFRMLPSMICIWNWFQFRATIRIFNNFDRTMLIWIIEVHIYRVFSLSENFFPNLWPMGQNLSIFQLYYSLKGFKHLFSMYICFYSAKYWHPCLENQVLTTVHLQSNYLFDCFISFSLPFKWLHNP